MDIISTKRDMISTVSLFLKKVDIMMKILNMFLEKGGIMKINVIGVN